MPKLYSELQLSVAGVSTACGSGRVFMLTTRPLPQAVLTWLPCRSGYIQSQTAIIHDGLFERRGAGRMTRAPLSGLDEGEVELLLVDVLVAVDVNCAEVVFDLCEHVALR